MKLWRIALLSLLTSLAWGQKINLGPPAVNGTLQASNCPALTGDVTASANTCSTTLTVNTITINTSSPLGGGGAVVLGGTLTITCTTCSTTTGTVTSIATTSPLGGGTITTTGTLTCTTCVVASSPGVGIAHFAGSTQTVTSSSVSLTADISGVLPTANGGHVSTFLTSDYTNATASFTDVTGLTGFSIAANTKYAIDCELVYQGSSSTTPIALQFTGPASPTVALFPHTIQVSLGNSSIAANTAVGFSAPAAGSNPTANVNLWIWIRGFILNGANAGTVQLQARSPSAGTVTIKTGSYCQIQQ